MADDNNNLRMLKMISNKTIAASGVYTSKPYDVSAKKLIGNITVHLKVTGTGTMKLEWSQSNSFDPQENSTGTFVLPVSGSEITNSFTVTSGSGSDGEDLINIPLFNSQYFKLIATETGGANSVVVDAWVSLQ